MPFVFVGTLLLLLKFLDIEPVAAWSWWWVLAPFALAVAWWGYADSTGLTQRRAIQRMEDRKQHRRERDMNALGLNVHSDRRSRAMKKAAEAAKDRAAVRKGDGS